MAFPIDAAELADGGSWWEGAVEGSNAGRLADTVASRPGIEIVRLKRELNRTGMERDVLNAIDPGS